MAAVSGDARRALDICRRSTEIADAANTVKKQNSFVTMSHIQSAVQEMFSSPKIVAIRYSFVNSACIWDVINHIYLLKFQTS